MGIKKIFGLLYLLAKVLGNGKAVSSGKTNKVTKVFGGKFAGKIAGKLLGKLFK